MAGFIDPAQFIQMIKNGKNPEQLMMTFLQQNMGGTPMGNQLIQMANNKDANGIERFARNYFKQQGIDFDTEFAAFKKTLGI